MSSAATKVSRRNFLKTTAASGAALVVGFHWSGAALAQDQPQEKPRVNPFNAWIHMNQDGEVILIVPKSEMGQGVLTSLAMILADELELDWRTVHPQHAETNPEIYDLGTGGSGSVLDCYLPLRQAAAGARQMLIKAAAQTWGVDPVTCHAKDGAVIHNPRAHRLAYSELVEKASKLPVPDLKTVRLKNPDDFRYIGKDIPHVDIPSKVDGSAQFGIDVRVPGMVHAVVARCPVYGGKAKSFDATKAKAVPGVLDVIEIPAIEKGCFTVGGIAVIANSSWAAMKGREALQIEWDNGPNADISTASLRDQMKSLTANPAKMIRSEGDVEAVLAKAGKKIEAEYELPFQAHATMEPMNCTADVRDDRAELWAPTQSPDWIQGMVAQVCGLKPPSVNVHTTLMGGGFGRRYHTDYGVEAAQVSKAAGKPVQVLWTREDDIQHDFYRPQFYHHLTAALDERGKITAWRHRMASTSIALFWRPTPKPEEQEVGGAVWLPYATSSFRLEYAPARSGIPVMWWRSVEASSNGFVVESFVDELAAAAKVDPLEFRLRLLGTPHKVGHAESPDDHLLDTGLMKTALQLAADKGGWGKPVAQGHALGIAAFYSFNTYAAHVAEVSVEARGKVRVHRITSAIDCGRAIDPNGVKAMVESAVVYALSAMLNEITVENGHATQSNFDTYDLLRMRDMPQVDVHIVPSTAAPTGMGEPGLPPVAPAVTNAIFALTGKRLRRLPIRPADLA
ncbi:MAG TPA: xanthine dehydrogenase family protein molybdopterin-binding subunit [Candidatus Limnocylindrales bacterium]|nr:xanthine dehydrogenase family protein molybdopterin-binding subunit [Candidatus Limnocylindrales bacterium]